jgi:hypothetical protein
VPPKFSFIAGWTRNYNRAPPILSAELYRDTLDFVAGKMDKDLSIFVKRRGWERFNGNNLIISNGYRAVDPYA